MKRDDIIYLTHIVEMQKKQMCMAKVYNNSKELNNLVYLLSLIFNPHISLLSFIATYKTYHFFHHYIPKFHVLVGIH